MDADNGICVRTKLNYFSTHFKGVPMRETWQPPVLTLQGISRPARDFVSWMWAAPVISERAKLVLEEMIQPHVEILLLTILKRKRYYALNVVTLLDCLDAERSDITRSVTDGRVLGVERFAFDPQKLRPVPIFKVPEDKGITLVSQEFVNAVQAAGLTGAMFVDPGKSPLEALFGQPSPKPSATTQPAGSSAPPSDPGASGKRPVRGRRR